MKQILITGASGFIGSHLIRQLRDKNYRIRAFILPNDRLKDPFSPYHFVENDPSLEIIYGDIRDPEQVNRAVKGCAWVFHLAAISALWIPRIRDYEEVNVRGTENIGRACAQFGVEKLVYTSSCETIGRSSSHKYFDESMRLSEHEAWGPYSRSKIKAEKIITDYSQKQGFAVIVNPSLPVGPGDAKPTPVGQMIQMFIRGNQKYYYPTGFNFINVHDAARGHILAAEKGKSGERYILGGPNLSLEDFFRKLEKTTSKKMPSKKVSYPLAYLGTWFMENLSHLTGHQPVSSLEGLKSVKKPFFMNCQKAKNELGFVCESIDEALRQEVEYFQSVASCQGSGHR